MAQNEPLAFRMRPRTIEEVLGQKHLLGEGKILWRMIQANRLTSMILYGPPGSGKTSIAFALAGSLKRPFRSFNAAIDSKKKLQGYVEEARFSGGLVLLIDEIHRMDKSKQDFLLPYLENGLLLVVGATTENPYLSINPAIRSRVEIFEVNPLTEEELLKGMRRALNDKERGLGTYHVKISEEALQFILRNANGDLRRALNSLELAVLSTAKNEEGVIEVSLAIAQESLQKKDLNFDRDGDWHYDVISAFQKSIRGSDVDAALFYGGLLLSSGDMEILCRRLMICAYEDVGLANPDAPLRAGMAVQTAKQIGLPEARIPLANAIIDLALSPKSNSAIKAIDAAMEDGKRVDFEIPDFLKDAHYQGAKELHHGEGYLFPHNYPGHWVKQDYLPEVLRHKHYYQAVNTGAYEVSLDEARRRREGKNGR